MFPMGWHSIGKIMKRIKMQSKPYQSHRSRFCRFWLCGGCKYQGLFEPLRDALLKQLSAIA